VPVRAARVDWTGDPGFDVMVAVEAAAEVWAAIRTAGEPSASRRGIGRLQHPAGGSRRALGRRDVDDSHLVLEAGLERGMQFQEAVTSARKW